MTQSQEDAGSRRSSVGSLYINRIEDSDDEPELPGLPHALIIANVPLEVFGEDHSDAQNKFEETFLEFDPDATFQYLKNFRRARVDFLLAAAAAKARIDLHEKEVLGQMINVYLAQGPDTPPNKHKSRYLELPKREKQFLISPPASPPVGWEPIPEGRPVMNDLLAAIAKLHPGGSHEVLGRTDSCPRIVVHLAPALDTDSTDSDAPRPKIPQTARPPPKLR